MDSKEASPDGDHHPQPVALPAASLDEDVAVERRPESGDHNPPQSESQVFHTQELCGFARQLGTEQTRSKLLPCLLTQCRAKEDAVKASFADEMGHFGDLVGGVEHVHTLFPILEALTTDENDAVRGNAVGSLMRLSEDLTGDAFQTQLYPVVERMCASQSVASRAASCALLAYSYTRVDDVTRDKLRRLYKKATWDAPLVREAAADALDRLAKIVEEPHLKNHLIIFKRFAFDSFVQVRVNVVKAAISLSSRLPAAQVQANILPSIKIFAKDPSTSVRLEVARIMVRFQEALGKSATVIHLVPMYHTLLGDPEASIREASAKHVNKFCRKIEKRFQKEIILQTILPAVLRLVDDHSPKVRSELASVVMDLCPIFCKRDVTKFLWQIFLQLLGDTANEVRVSIVNNLGGLKRFITLHQFDTLVVSFIKSLTTSHTWRCRLEATACIYKIATKLGKKFFTASLLEICVGLLVDDVYTVREEMGVVLGKIVTLFAPEWTKDKLLKKVLGIANRERYLHRLSFLSCMSKLAKPCGTELTTSTILPAVVTLSKDPIPNVRFNVAKTLNNIAHVLAESSLEKQVLPVLKSLQNDADVDVVYFAEEAFNVISEMCKPPCVQEESNTT